MLNHSGRQLKELGSGGTINPEVMGKSVQDYQAGPEVSRHTFVSRD
jgi:hypothetical protein